MLKASKSNLVAIAIAFVLVAAIGACGGGGGSLGNAQPWCPLADDFIDSAENLSDRYRSDAKISQIEEADEAFYDARERLQDVEGAYDRTSYEAIDDLTRTGSRVIEFAEENDDERYDDSKEDFEDAKDLVKRICS